MKSLSQLDGYVIAEVGVNHEGSFDKAVEMIKSVSRAGGGAVKFQTYKASTLAAKNSPAYWDINEEPTKTQFELFSKFDTFDEDDYIKLAKSNLIMLLTKSNIFLR